MLKCEHASKYKGRVFPRCNRGEGCDACLAKWKELHPNHGWFTIPGFQTGERDIKERVLPLRPLLKFTKGATILDLGCAEGCIGKWLVDEGGAAYVHGIDKHQPWLAVASQQMPSPPYNARFSYCDFDAWTGESKKLGLLQHFDIVLCLNVAQKLFQPKHFIRAVANLAANIFVYSGPDAILQDARSKNVPVDIVATLKACGFDLIHFDKGARHAEKGHLGVRIIFKRKGKKKNDIRR